MESEAFTGINCPKCNDPLRFASGGELEHEDGTAVCKPYMVPYAPVPAVPAELAGIAVGGRYLCHHGNDGATCPRCGKAEAVLRAEIPAAQSGDEGEAPGGDRGLDFPWGFVAALLALVGWAVAAIGYVAFGWFSGAIEWAEGLL